MRRIIEEVTCDDCGQVYAFEKTKLDSGQIVMRLEDLTSWLVAQGWRCSRIEGSGMCFRDQCPQCKKGL